MDRSSPTIDLLRHTIKPNKINVPLVTDHYFINDIIFYVASQWLVEMADRGNVYRYVCNSLYDYIESVLEPEDIDLLNQVADEVVKQAGIIIDMEELEYLKNKKGVENVYYRLEPAEKHVRLFIAIDRTA